ncbi:unnamed protein product [Protopolystoma xenopodis]|uniref:Uncharacterized protein n=1 Tax=Protopolystoma xenopodis TaxID=117903 RepID=A0A3S5BTY5_9PLAT|nr:unnamed protein product [Protopolystoma xenopodis]
MQFFLFFPLSFQVPFNLLHSIIKRFQSPARASGSRARSFDSNPPLGSTSTSAFLTSTTSANTATITSSSFSSSSSNSHRMRFFPDLSISPSPASAPSPFSPSSPISCSSSSSSTSLSTAPGLGESEVTDLSLGDMDQMWYTPGIGYLIESGVLQGPYRVCTLPEVWRLHLTGVPNLSVPDVTVSSLRRSSETDATTSQALSAIIHHSSQDRSQSRVETHPSPGAPGCGCIMQPVLQPSPHLSSQQRHQISSVSTANAAPVAIPFSSGNLASASTSLTVSRWASVAESDSAHFPAFSHRDQRLSPETLFRAGPLSEVPAPLFSTVPGALGLRLTRLPVPRGRLRSSSRIPIRCLAAYCLAPIFHELTPPD